MRPNPPLLLLLLVSLLLAAAPSAAGEPGLATARARLLKGLRASDPDERRNAVWELDGFDGREAARTLVRSVLTRDDRAAVVEAAIRLLSEMKDEEAIAVLASEARSGHWRKRARVLESLRRIKTDKALATLLEAAYDEDPRVRTGALLALEDQGGGRPDFSLLDALRAPSWPVRSAAIAILRRRATEDAVPALIDRLFPGREDGRLVQDVAGALARITQERYGPSYLRWFAWDAERTGGETTLTFPPPGTASPPPRVQLGRTASWARRVVFVLAIHKTMGDDVRAPAAGFAPRDVKEAGGAALKRWEEIETKLDLAKLWLERSITALPPDVEFNIVTYGPSANAVFTGLVPATAVNRDKAVRRIASLSPSGNANLWDGLMTVYTLVSKDPLDEESLRNGPEAVFLLSDGTADYGEIPETDVVAAEIGRLNLYRQIRFHSFGIGDHDARVLADLAGMIPGGTVGSIP